MYQPSALMAVRVAGGLLGRKTKQGFYNYDGPPAASAPTCRYCRRKPPASAWIADEDGGRDLAEWLTSAGVKTQVGGAPARSALLRDAARRRRNRRHRPAQARSGAHGRGRHARVASKAAARVMKTPLTAPETLGAAVAALSADAPVTVINDSPGFVVQRLLAMIVNIGSRIAELRIAAPADIDTAVELGLNYPKGPLALGDTLGAQRVLAVLDGMQAVTRDPKYRATAWLRRRALLGISLLTPD